MEAVVVVVVVVDVVVVDVVEDVSVLVGGRGLGGGTHEKAN